MMESGVENPSLAATLAGSALGALREYNHHHHRHQAALHVYACASSVWVPLPSADAYLYDNQDDLELPPVNIRFLPPLVDYAFQTVAIFYLLFFHVLLLVSVAFILHVFAD